MPQELATAAIILWAVVQIEQQGTDGWKARFGRSNDPIGSIRRKAEYLYRSCLQARLEGDESYFPRLVPASRIPDAGNLGAAAESMRRLREGAKRTLGFGYTMEWQEVNSRKFGRNKVPTRVLFETREDLFHFIGKEKEFRAFAAVMTRLRAEFPELESWFRSSTQKTIDIIPEFKRLLYVILFLREHPEAKLLCAEAADPG